MVLGACANCAMLHTESSNLLFENQVIITSNSHKTHKLLIYVNQIQYVSGK